MRYDDCGRLAGVIVGSGFGSGGMATFIPSARAGIFRIFKDDADTVLRVGLGVVV